MFQTNELRSRLPFKVIIPMLLISVLCVVSFAASATISNGSTYKAIGGEIISITGNYEVTPVGFSLATENTNAHDEWSTVDPLTTYVTAGNWIYTIKVKALTNNPATVSVSWSQSGNPEYSLLGSITISDNPVIGQEATFVFDTGVASFDSPVGILITVK
jgi:hypothetical protein